jgi:hypothetical protein
MIVLAMASSNLPDQPTVFKGLKSTYYYRYIFNSNNLHFYKITKISGNFNYHIVNCGGIGQDLKAKTMSSSNYR